jgi:DNA-binding transcriptional regulator YiaG
MRLTANNYEAKDVLRFIREWMELSQSDLAKEINRCERTVQEYEAGRTKYTMNMLLDFANKHGLTITIEKK